MKNTVTNTNLYQPKLLYDFKISYENDIPSDDISRTVVEVVEGANVLRYVDFSNRNSYGYDGMLMLQAVILAFSIYGYASTRQLESLCRFDIRFKFIMRGDTPSHMAFQRFLTNDLKMPLEDIFHELNKYIDKNDVIDTSVLYIDGSKFEANANKMTFVWKKATLKYREKLWIKINKALVRLNKYLKENEMNVVFSILKETNLEYLLEIVRQLKKLILKNSIEIKNGKGSRKHPLQKFYEEFDEYTASLLKYTIHLDLLGDRNSFSKTDPDATFMHMKYDYYNHTNVFKPGYNVQIGISDGYIRHMYISADANDVNTFIPFMKGYYAAYGEYPKKTPADAGYGSFDNYSYCREHDIDLYMKYPMQTKEKEKLNDKNRFKSYKFEINEDDEIICPAGHAFTFIKSRIETRGIYEQVNEMYVNEHCDGCPLRKRCTKSKDGRSLTRNHELEDFHHEVVDNMSTPEGKSIMIQRSIQAEGVFGQIKEDNKYARIRRRGNSGVKEELLLVGIGHNIRRYHIRKLNNLNHLN